MDEEAKGTISSKVFKAAKAHLKLNSEGEGVLTRGNKKSKKSKAPPAVWELDAADDAARQRYADTEEAYSWCT